MRNREKRYIITRVLKQYAIGIRIFYYLNLVIKLLIAFISTTSEPTLDNNTNISINNKYMSRPVNVQRL